MIEQPKHSPSCCGQEAKWVNPTLNLAYFYCTKCKKEVEEQGTKGIGDYFADLTALYDTLPTGRFKVGDIVSFDVVDYSQGPYRTFGTVYCVGIGGWYHVETLGKQQTHCLYETALTLVP